LILDERAGERDDQRKRGLGINLGVVSADEVENVAGVFDKRMLEAAACTEEGDCAFASYADPCLQSGRR
jgi:hypothetical protein